MKMHVDAADLAALNPADPELVSKVRGLLTYTLAVAGNPAAALCLLVTAIGSLADNTDDPAGVLGTASVLIIELLDDVSADLSRELRRPDGDGDS